MIFLLPLPTSEWLTDDGSRKRQLKKIDSGGGINKCMEEIEKKERERERRKKSEAACSSYNDDKVDLRKKQTKWG
jgi:hypothetical protein